VPPALHAHDLYRFHAVEGTRVPILKGISFEMAERSLLTIMGPSGSGKSTLLHILAGLDVPSAGEVRIGGELLPPHDEEARTRMRRERIGFIFQFFNLLPDLTVEENIALPLLIAGKAPERERARIDELLERLGLDKLRRRLPHRLSGGEMQRVSIARALVTRPPLLFADEPTGNLSSKAGEEIIGLLRMVRDELGASVLLVTHNPRDAAAGDCVMFLNDGAMRADQALTGGGFRAADVFRRLEELGI
jgi:putative ABC transport system ATP-binding protein